MAAILHVTTRERWEQARTGETYSPPELARDGFLHCCTPGQLPFVLERHFPGATGLVVLELDPAATGARLDWVRSEPGQDPFPHLHGPIPAAAVVNVSEAG